METNPNISNQNFSSLSWYTLLFNFHLVIMCHNSSTSIPAMQLSFSSRNHLILPMPLLHHETCCLFNHTFSPLYRTLFKLSLLFAKYPQGSPCDSTSLGPWYNNAQGQQVIGKTNSQALWVEYALECVAIAFCELSQILPLPFRAVRKEYLFICLLWNFPIIQNSELCTK